MNSGSWPIIHAMVGYPGYLHKVRGALLALSIFVVTLAGLAAASLPGATEFRHQREHELTPAASKPTEATYRFFQTGSDRLWAGNRVTRVFVAPARDHSLPPTPPGAPAFPAPGEVYVSPHLKSLERSDPLVRALLADLRVVGTIRPEGLSEPDENRAVIGLASADADRLTPGSTWGATPLGSPSEARVMIVLGIFLALLVLIPALALAAITARLGESERGDRSAILRMLGAPPRVAAEVSAAEVAIVGVPASVLAMTVFSWFTSKGVHVPVVDLSVFPQAATLIWPAQVFVGLLAVVMHAVIAAKLSARGHTSLQPLLATQPLRLRSLWLLVGGVVMLIALALVTTLPPALAGLAFFAGVAAVALSLATALPTATRWLAGRTAPRARHGGTLYGLRLLAERSLPSTRIAALMALVIVALGTAVPFLAILNGGGTSGLTEYAARHPKTIVSVFDSGLGLGRAAKLIPGASSVSMFTARGKTEGGVTVLAATCAEVERLLAAKVQPCPDAPVWLSDQTDLPPAGVSRLSASPQDLSLPPVSEAIHIDSLPGELGGVLLVPPDVARTLNVETSSLGLVASITTDSVDEYLARVSVLAPWAQTRTDAFEYSNPDQKLYPGTRRLVILAAWTSLILAALSLLAASLGEVAVQRRRSGELDVLGAGHKDFRRLHLTTTAAPLMVAGAAATVVSILVGRAIVHMDDRAVSPPTMYLAMAIGTLVVSAGTAAVTAPLMQRPRHGS